MIDKPENIETRRGVPPVKDYRRRRAAMIPGRLGNYSEQRGGK